LIFFDLRPLRTSWLIVGNLGLQFYSTVLFH